MLFLIPHPRRVWVDYDSDDSFSLFDDFCYESDDLGDYVAVC